MSTSKKQCFVIMPFSKTSERHTGNYWNKHFNDFLKPLIEKNSHFEARRSEPIRGDILKQIITNLIVSPLVVADLTDLNPNVFWELGVRQSFPKQGGTITIAQVGTKLPFDVSTKGTLFYHLSQKKNDDFFAKFGKAISSCLNYPISPDSVIWDTISGRGTFYEVIQKEETIRRVDALIEEIEFNTYWIEVLFKLVDEKANLAVVNFISSALEQLLTQRYLDEDAKFYKDLRTIYINIPILNKVLDMYPNEWNKIMTYFGGPDLWKKALNENLKKKMMDQIKVLKDIREKLQKAY